MSCSSSPLIAISTKMNYFLVESAATNYKVASLHVNVCVYTVHDCTYYRF